MSSIDDEELDRSQYFVDTIQDHLLCPICSGVFAKPVLLCCCGQSLCENCLLKSMESCDKCPMCRREEQTTVPFVQNRVVDDHIQAMKVKCMNNKDPNACDCSWTGQVSEWKNHVDNECEICEISCPVAGCDFKGRRRDMVAHNSTNIMHHTRLLIDAEVADHETKHEKQIKDLNEKISNMDSKIIDLQKNHKNGIKKLKNEIIKKDAKTDDLIKKYEQIDDKISDLETKHEKEIKDLNEKICSDQIKLSLVDAKVADLETKHEKQIKDLNDKNCSSIDSKVTDLQKNHTHGIKKLRNEIIKRDANTAVLIKKHEQMDDKITDLETKHEKEIKDLNNKICDDHIMKRANIAVNYKLYPIERDLTTLRKENRILKRKMSNLEASTSDNAIGTDIRKDGSFPMVLYQESDEHELTAYQCLLRKQFELFEANEDDVLRCSSCITRQGRTALIKLGQVGLRCRHCARVQSASRKTGAAYYPKTVESIYYMAHSMSKVHLCKRCYVIPRDVRCQLIVLQSDYQRAIGGEEYWSEKIRSLGVYADEGILRVKCGPKEEKKEEGQNGKE